MKSFRPGLIILLVMSTISSDGLHAQLQSLRKVENNTDVISRAEKITGVTQAEEPDVLQIKQKAKADAELDSDLQNNDIWCGTSIILSWGVILLQQTHGDKTSDVTSFGILAALAGLPIAAYLAEVKLPENREKDLSTESLAYQEIYRSEYTSEVKRQRVKNSLVGPVILAAVAGIQMGWSLVRLGEPSESENGDSEDG